MYPGIDFNDKLVWITGASSGIGAAIAMQLAAKGSRLVLSSRNEDTLQTVATACRDNGAKSVMVLPLDVTDYDSLPLASQKVLADVGAIDLLINNAGVSQRSLCVDTDFSVYERMLNINVLGQIALTKAVLPSMITRGQGHIAVTSSIAGKVGAPMRTGYCAAKHAVMGFFDALRTEVDDEGIQVTTITPGFISTDVDKNALGPDGRPTGKIDADIANGMNVEECAAIIVKGFEAGDPEIAVAEETGLQLLQLKRENPVAAFQALAEVAAQAKAKR